EERAKAVARYQKVKALSIQTLTQLKEELAALKALASTLSGNKRELEQTVSGLEERLARSEQEKAAMVVDYRGKIEAAQNAFNALRDQSARNIGGLETQVKVRDEQVEALRSEIKALQGTLAARDATQVEAEKRILELLTRLDALDGQVAGHVTELATRDARLGELTATLGERDKALAQLAEEMSRLRAENEARLGDVRRLAKLQEDEAARLQVEVGKLQGELKQAAEACDKHRTEIERLKQQLTKM
ncbi:MAG TPA: hypothetical protein VFH51_09825, partial [Myxococcota bacterium]|nr:hypothetical protein [Myxococcota bacterium]